MLRTQHARARQWGQSCWAAVSALPFHRHPHAEISARIFPIFHAVRRLERSLFPFENGSEVERALQQWHVYSILPSQYNDNKYCTNIVIIVISHLLFSGMSHDASVVMYTCSHVDALLYIGVVSL
jgi:hypothetical protein